MPIVIVGNKNGFCALTAKSTFSRTGAMAHYRLYILGKRRVVAGAVDFDCSDDEAAKERAKVVLGDQCGELWRLVTTPDADNPTVGPKLQ
jgi:hypothetical protein